MAADKVVNPIENLKDRQDRDMYEQEKKLQAKQELQYETEYNNSIAPDIDSLVNNLSEVTLTEQDKEALHSKIRGIYISEKIRKNEFDLEKTLKTAVSSMAFTEAGEPEDFLNFQEYQKSQMNYRSSVLEALATTKNSSSSQNNEIQGDGKDKKNQDRIEQDSFAQEDKLELDIVENEEVHSPETSHGEEKEALDSKEKVKYLQERPFYPIIKGFENIFDKNIITIQIDYSSIDKLYNEKGKDKNSVEFMNILLQNANDLQLAPQNETKIDGKELQGYFKKYLHKTLELNQKQIKQETDSQSGKIINELPDAFKTEDILVQNKNSEVVQIMTQNFISLPNQSGSTTAQKNIETSFEITANKIIEGKNFERTQTFNDAMNQVKSGTTEKRLEALQTIYNFVNISEGKKDKKNKNKNIKEKQDKINDDINSKEFLESKIQELQKEYENLKTSSERKEQIINEIEKLQDKTIEGGDIFGKTTPVENENNISESVNKKSKN